MKKIFIASLSLNPNLQTAKVNPIGFELNTRMTDSYNPIVPIMESFVEEGDIVKLLVIRQKTTNEADKNNMAHLENELSYVGLLEKVRIEEIILEEWQSKEVLLTLFEELINRFENDALYYADVTFGVKPYPIILNTAFRYVDKVLKNTDIRGIYYQEIVRNENGKPIDARLFDVSVLPTLFNMIDFIGEVAPDNASRLIGNLLHPEGGEDNAIK